MKEVENYRDPFAVAVSKIGSNRQSRPKKDIVMFDVFKTR